MRIEELATGIQHIGLPTNSIEKTLEFYQGLGFTVEWQTENGKLAFLKLKNLVIETYESGNATEKAGAIDHIAIDVSDVDAAFELIKSAGHKMLHEEVQFLPFFEHGVRFFTIEGPNAEKVEFNQILMK